MSLNSVFGMHLAAEKGKYLRLRSFLSGDVNALDARGSTALSRAASNGHLRCVTMLLDANADVNALSKHNRTAIMDASYYGHLDVVNTLIEARADLNVVTTDSFAVALDLACKTPDNHPIVAALLAAGALVDVPGSKVFSFTIAIQANSIESMKLLIAAGVDVNHSDGTTTPLCTAADCGNLTAVELLIDAKADVNALHVERFPLLAAVKTGSVEMIKLFIAAGADVNMCNSNHEAPLHHLVGSFLPNGRWMRQRVTHELYPRAADMLFNSTPSDYPGVFEVLIDTKADIAARGPKCMTPLHVAAVGNNVEAVNALLSAGAPLNDKDSSGSTPLMTASCEGHLAVASALIAAGADVNQVNNSGRTALALAVSHNHPDIVSALIAAGVDVNRVHTFGQMKISVLDTVLSHNVHIAALLENAGAKSTLSLMAETSALVEAASRGDIERVNKLIGNAEEEERDMALAVAVDQGMRPMVQCLLAGGANPGTEHLGLRMLSLASIEGDIDVVRDLLDAGADIAFKDHNGQTALQHAAQFQKRDVVALLLAKAKELKNANK